MVGLDGNEPGPIDDVVGLVPVAVIGGTSLGVSTPMEPESCWVAFHGIERVGSIDYMEKDRAIDAHLAHASFRGAGMVPAQPSHIPFVAQGRGIKPLPSRFVIFDRIHFSKRQFEKVTMLSPSGVVQALVQQVLLLQPRRGYDRSVEVFVPGHQPLAYCQEVVEASGLNEVAGRAFVSWYWADLVDGRQFTIFTLKIHD